MAKYNPPHHGDNNTDHPPTIPPAKILLTHPAHFLALGLGSGLSPIMPGTCGTIAGVIIWLLCLQWLPFSYYVIFLVITFLAGIYFCEKAAKALNKDDPGCVVWDEFVGVWLTFIPLFFYANKVTWLHYLIAFILFRAFDMIKPWPIKWADQKVKGGLGIMLDDIIAGVIAMCLLIIIRLFY